MAASGPRQPDVVFLDANVLFSAAYRPDAGLRRLWRLPDVRLLTSAYAAVEARRNLGDARRRERLDRLLAKVHIVPEVEDRPTPGAAELPDKDRPIVLAAVAARATYLLTGDVTHFGRLLGKRPEGVLVLIPADYLRDREDPQCPIVTASRSRRSPRCSPRSA